VIDRQSERDVLDLASTNIALEQVYYLIVVSLEAFDITPTRNTTSGPTTKNMIDAGLVLGTTRALE